MIPPYHKVNETLFDLLAHIQDILNEHCIGVYVYGSLALGDFDPRYSDVDLMVVTTEMLSDDIFSLLENMHMQFNASNSPWANKVEVAYIPLETLSGKASSHHRYPQVEKGRRLAREPLEIGWPFQCYILREHAIILAGPDPRELMEPVDFNHMVTAADAIVKLWLEESEHDPTWLEWIRQKNEQSFVVLTLCRLLNTLATRTVNSKKLAAQWAKEHLDKKWIPLIEKALKSRGDAGQTSDRELYETITFLHNVAPALLRAS